MMRVHPAMVGYRTATSSFIYTNIVQQSLAVLSWTAILRFKTVLGLAVENWQIIA